MSFWSHDSREGSQSGVMVDRLEKVLEVAAECGVSCGTVHNIIHNHLQDRFHKTSMLKIATYRLQHLMNTWRVSTPTETNSKNVWWLVIRRGFTTGIQNSTMSPWVHAWKWKHWESPQQRNSGPNHLRARSWRPSSWMRNDANYMPHKSTITSLTSLYKFTTLPARKTERVNQY